MVIPKALLLALVTASTMALVGCPGDGTHPTTAIRPGATSAASAGKGHDLVARRGHPATKAAPRETFLSSYSDPEEGISFRYPRYYALEEGDLEEHSFFLKRQDDLDIEQPGTRLVATALIPEDSYPNTTFEHGSLQLFVDDYATPESCKAPASGAGEGTEQDPKAIRNLTLEGVVFHGSELQSETAGTDIWERNYAGFAGDSCYRFRLVVAAEAAAEGGAEPNTATKPADEARILRQLEKILGSVQFQEKRAVLPDEVHASVPRL